MGPGPKGTEGAGGRAHGAALHLLAALVSWGSPIRLRVSQCDTHLQENWKEDLESHRPVSLTSIPRKSVEQNILSVTSQGARPSQHTFMRGSSCLTNLILQIYDCLNVTALLTISPSSWATAYCIQGGWWKCNDVAMSGYLIFCLGPLLRYIIDILCCK